MNHSLPSENISVIVDTTPLCGEKTGIGNYVHYLLKFLLSNKFNLSMQGVSFGLHKFQKDSLEIVQQLKHNTRLPIPVRILNQWWRYFDFPKIDNLISGVNILHFTNYYLPPIHSARTVLSVYDLSFLTTPQWVSPQITNLFKPTIARSVQRATRIITCSEKSKKDIEKYLNVPGEKISVAYPGIDKTIFHPEEWEEAQDYIQKHYNVKVPFLLFVGTIEERKNVIGLLNMFEKIYKQIPHSLVLIGKKGFKSDEIFLKIQTMESKDRVFYLDYIQDHSELRWFYNAADLFVFPSFEEGFGIPPLEAMACGCPVMVSNQGALPEVVGPSGIQISPDDMDTFSTTILEILNNAEISAKLKKEGTIQSNKFTWDKTAKVHYEIYKELAEL